MRLLLIASLFAAACSEGGGGGTGIDNPAGFDQQINNAFCTYNARCGYYGQSEVKQCQSDAAAAAKMYTPTYSTTDAVKAKRLAYNAKQAQACIDAIAKAGCSNDSYYALADSCNPVFQGLVPAGGSCLSGSECIKGNWCDQGPAGSAGCTGVCTANLATNSACDSNDPHCNDADFCDDTSMKCLARAKVGSDCGPSAQCQLGNYYCKGYDQGPPEVLGTCSGLAAVGEACSNSFFGTTNCAFGLWCDDSDPTGGVCATPIANGMSCTSYLGCADGFDCLGLAFDDQTGDLLTTGKCGPFLDVGKACSTTGESGCPFDTTCDAASSTCKGGAPAGTACDPTAFSSGCSSSTYCDGNTSKCATPVALGAACTPPPVDSAGFPQGGEPCHDGACDATSNKCALICM